MVLKKSPTEKNAVGSCRLRPWAVSLLLIAFMTVSPRFATVFAAELVRQATIRHVEVSADGLARVFVAVTEEQQGVPYPITTLDRSMFSVFFGYDPGMPAPVASLWPYAAMVPAGRRATVLAFDLSTYFAEREQNEIRETINQILPDVYREFITVLGVNARETRVIFEVTPRSSDNVKAIQHAVMTADSDFALGNATQVICKAAEKFEIWQPFLPDPADQLSVIMIMPLGFGGQETPQEQSCWQRLYARKVRVFAVTFPEPSQSLSSTLIERVRQSGGFVQIVAAPQDLFPALSNVAANLNSEYVLDVRPTTAVQDPALHWLKVKVDYHGNIIQSMAHNYTPPLVPDPSARKNPEETSFAAPVPAEHETVDLQHVSEGVSILVVVGMTTALVWWRRKRQMTMRRCPSCHRKVSHDFADCPFSRAQCVGRLMLLEKSKKGTTIKRIFPVNNGDNLLGTAAKCDLRMARRRGISSVHAMISIKSKRALYQPLRKSTDTINGWPLDEPRLFGHGAMFKIGKSQFCFEAKLES